MYVITLLKLLQFVNDRIVDQKYAAMPIYRIFRPNSNIIVIIKR
jgi:hypothetical protein